MRLQKYLLSVAMLFVISLFVFTNNKQEVQAKGKQSSNCKVTLNLKVKGSCQLVKRDNSATKSKKAIVKRWGSIDCQNFSRIKSRRDDDPHATAFGKKDNNNRYRLSTVKDGDDFYGERCELGRNEHRLGQKGTFHLYKQGRTETTFFSVYLGKNYPLSNPNWQVIMQMKQANPSDTTLKASKPNPPGYSLSPILELDAYNGQFRLGNNWKEKWTAPAYKNRWIRFAMKTHYSPNPKKGWMKIYVDLNEDKDVRDKHERSRKIHMQTLKRESAGPNDDDGIKKGRGIPGHLRMGVYHNPEIKCKPCSMKFDNVQIVR